MLNLKDEMPNKQLFEAMKKANERGSLMSCAINVLLELFANKLKENLII